METGTKSLVVIMLVFKVLQRAANHTALFGPPASCFLCVVGSLLSVCCPSAPHHSFGVNWKPAGWSILVHFKVTLVNARITWYSLQEAQWLPFSRQT